MLPVTCEVKGSGREWLKGRQPAKLHLVDLTTEAKMKGKWTAQVVWEEKYKGKVISRTVGDKTRAEMRELTGKMGHSVPSDCACAGLQAPRQPDFCILGGCGVQIVRGRWWCARCVNRWAWDLFINPSGVALSTGVSTGPGDIDTHQHCTLADCYLEGSNPKRNWDIVHVAEWNLKLRIKWSVMHFSMYLFAVESPPIVS